MTKAERAYPLMLTEYPDILTAEQTAKILGIGRHQVYKMIDRGELFGIKLSGSYKIAKLRLIEYLIGQAGYDTLKSQYPPVISADQFRQICHISKRKAKWLLENEIVPCKDSGKKTRRFSIRLDDTIAYLKARENAPTLVATPPGAFSSGYQHSGSPPKRDPVLPAIFERYLLQRWRNAPDALSILQAQELTGYTAGTLCEWISTGRLQAVWYYNRYQIPKVSLIACLMKLESESRHYYSPQHLAMIQDISL